MTSGCSSGAASGGLCVAALALSGGRPVSVDALVDLLWGDAPPDGVSGTLQVYVSGLRRVLEPERAPRAPATVLVTVEPGYALVLPDGGLDAARFDRAVSEAHRLLRPRRAGQKRPAWVPTGVAAADLRAARRASTRRWTCGAARRTSSSRRRPPRSPSGPGSRSSAPSRWRTAPSPRSRWATTPRSRPSSSR